LARSEYAFPRLCTSPNYQRLKLRDLVPIPEFQSFMLPTLTLARDG
jgi:hypothetical protein